MAENYQPADPESKRVHPRVLIVDDDQDIVKLLSLHLRSEGYSVEVAYDGLEALDKISETQPDVIILDLMMPKVDGSVVCLSVKHTSVTRHIRIIILTAKIQTKDKIEELCKLEADLYMTKPFELEELSQNIESLLAVPAESSESKSDPYFRGQN
ncbi:MAG: response regulator [Candidatus Firestonebacteria bacterium]|nr:response regulator [Candidatus Firestonebacteria bacterium]